MYMIKERMIFNFICFQERVSENSYFPEKGNFRPSKIDLLISGPRPHLQKICRIISFYPYFTAWFYFISSLYFKSINLLREQKKWRYRHCVSQREWTYKWSKSSFITQIWIIEYFQGWGRYTLTFACKCPYASIV